MAYIAWPTEYFDWQFGADQPDRRIAAYDEEQLVGVIAGRSAGFVVGGESFQGAHYSWLSIPPEFQGRKIAPFLDIARVRAELDLQSDLLVSYRFHGSKHSLAERPRATHSTAALKDFNRRIGFWARPLNPTLLRKWNLKSVEGWLAQLAGPLLPGVRVDVDGKIRDFRPDDLVACLNLMNESKDQFMISNDWDQESLRWQLSGHPITQTVVAEAGGEVCGFVNFHILPFQGRTRQPVGVIDLLSCDRLSFNFQRRLMNDVLARMRDQSAILALKSRTGDLTAALSLSTGFSFQPASSDLVLQWINSRRFVSPSGRARLLWR